MGRLRENNVSDLPRRRLSSFGSARSVKVTRGWQAFSTPMRYWLALYNAPVHGDPGGAPRHRFRSTGEWGVKVFPAREAGPLTMR